MSRSKRFDAGAEEIDSAESSVSHILKLVLGLSADKVRSGQALATLNLIREAIERLISETSRSASSQPEAPSAQHQPNIYKKSASFFQNGDDSELSDTENSYWRTKRKTQTQRDEKKARLAKREELIRQLRTRVSESLRNDISETSAQGEPSSPPFDSGSADRFSTRLQRASFWPEGSVEWARQLLGIEMSMTESEKRQCYIEMVKLCHPDHNSQVSTDAIQMVNSAWDLLR